MRIACKVPSGSVGDWGVESVPAMGPRPTVAETEAKELVGWTLALKQRAHALRQTNSR
jgi:hypothetical protein